MRKNVSSDRRKKIKSIIQCPRCGAGLAWLDTAILCNQCRAGYPVREGVPDMGVHAVEKTKDAEFQTEQMTGSTFTAKLYNMGKRLINSEYIRKNQLEEMLRALDESAIAVELGSGNRRLSEDFINIDMFGFPNVDIIADITKIPLGNDAVDLVIIDTVLEHVPEPHRIVDEIYRVLKPGGRVLCITPFIFPYHGYPKHYYNISKDGLEHLFRNFTECTIEMNMGPTSALTNLLSEYVAVALAGESKFFYTFWKGVALAPIFFLKYLDKFWSPEGNGMRISSCLCAVARK